MPSFRVDGLEDLIRSFDDLASLPDEVTEEMLNAEADVVVAAQKRTAEGMLQGRYYKGAVARGVTKGKMQTFFGGKVQYITFKGSVKDKKHKKGTRVAEIAFINEFGKVNQPARPFVNTANEESADAAVGKAADVYDRYLKSKGF